VQVIGDREEGAELGYRRQRLTDSITFQIGSTTRFLISMLVGHAGNETEDHCKEGVAPC